MNTAAKGLGHGPTPGPSGEFLPGWRAACLAYRHEWRKDRCNGGLMHQKAVEALLAEHPHVAREEASEQAVRAVHWASVYYNAWLYRR